MRPLTPRTAGLLDLLGRRPGLLAGWLHPAGSAPRRLLQELVAAGEPEAALALLAYAVDATGRRRELILGAVDAVIRAAPLEAIPWLEQRARTTSPWGRSAWAHSAKVTPEAARELTSASALGVASLHASGWVRQAAVEGLSACSDPLALPFLLLRANDWVGPVRAAACAGLERRLTQIGPAPFVPWLPILDRLRLALRSDQTQLVGAVHAALVGPDGREALRLGCISPAPRVRRCCLTLALETRPFDLEPVVRDGLEDSDPWIRSLVARRFASLLPDQAVEAILPELLRSRTPRVRETGLALLWERAGDATRGRLEPFLLDPNPRIRALVRWRLRDAPGLDALTRCRLALTSGTEGLAAEALVGALGCLGEVGSAPDATLALPFLAAPSSAVRTAAVLAIGALDAGGHREALLAALVGRSPRTAREAVGVLSRGPPVEEARILELARRPTPDHAWPAALTLARAHDFWDAGILLLRLASLARGPARRRPADDALRWWMERFDRTFTQPTPGQAAAFEQLVEAGAGLDAPMHDRFRHLLGAVRIRRGSR